MYRCLVVINFVFMWSVFEVLFVDLYNESKLFELFEDFVRMVEFLVMDFDLEIIDLIIWERKFLFGFIKFNFKFGFIGKEWDLLVIFGIYIVWVEVKWLELEVVI